jgi:hypothetical protein
MIERLLFLSISFATMSLAAGLALNQTWIWLPFPLLWALLWLIGHRRKWAWIADFEFAIYILLAISGLWVSISPGWVLVGMVSTLIAWDAAGFLLRVHDCQSQADVHRLAYEHYRRVLPVILAGFALAALTLNLNLTLDFSSILLLGLIAILGLSRMIGFLRKVSD